MSTAVVRKQISSAEVLIYEDKAALVDAAVTQIAAVLRECITARGTCTLALSGGSTPQPIYQRFAAMSGVDWTKVQLCFVDERNVPVSHPDSNYGMVDRAFLESDAVPQDHIHRIPGELDAAQAAQAYESELRTFLKPEPDGFPVFDLILLGIGPDGHTASLFPQSPALADQEHWVAANWVEKMQTHRITLTFPVINHARRCMFLVAGADKQWAVTQVLVNSGSALPAAKIIPRNGTATWLMDRDAGAPLL